MRAGFVGCVLGIALLTAASFAAETTPIPNDTQTAVNFFLATCQGSADNLSSVAELAKQQNWTSILNPAVPETGPLKVNGIWRVSQNGQSYAVTTGTGPRGNTTCQVGFYAPKPTREDFVAAISKAVTLNVEADTKSPDWRSEMYQIENLAPKYVILQFVSNNGAVYEASVIGPRQASPGAK